MKKLDGPPVLSQSFLCLKVKTRKEERAANMVIDLHEGEIKQYISSANTPTKKLLDLFKLLASRGVEVLFFGQHRRSLYCTHILRNGVLFQLEKLKKGKSRKKQSSRPAFLEIFIP